MVAVSCSTASFCLAVGQTANFAPADFYYFKRHLYPTRVAFASTDNSSFERGVVHGELGVPGDRPGRWRDDLRVHLVPAVLLAHPAAPTAIDAGVKNYAGASIACVSATSCVVGSFANQVSTYNGTTWSTTAVFASSSLGVLVSCAQSTCVANDSSSQGVSAVAPFTTWSATGQLSSLSQITGLSCSPPPRARRVWPLTTMVLDCDHPGSRPGLPSYSEGQLVIRRSAHPDLGHVRQRGLLHRE